MAVDEIVNHHGAVGPFGKGVNTVASYITGASNDEHIHKLLVYKLNDKKNRQKRRWCMNLSEVDPRTTLMI